MHVYVVICRYLGGDREIKEIYPNIKIALDRIEELNKKALEENPLHRQDEVYFIENYELKGTNFYPQLLEGFLEAMNDIGAYGEQKHKALSFQSMQKRGDYGRHERVTWYSILDHMQVHAGQYDNDVKHDHFHTLKHQLAAIAFNAMMEYHFARLEELEKK